MKRVGVILVLMLSSTALAAEVIPPSPPAYFNDYANVISPGTRQRLNQQLIDFEKQTSNEIVVAIYAKMQSDLPIEDYAVRVYQAWKIGTKRNNNGALLLIYTQDHKMRIATGYGLEGALPDALCKQIMDDEIAPRFKEGNYDAGLTAGVAAMIAATKGEYKARSNNPGWMSFLGLGFILVIFLGFFTAAIRKRGVYYRSRGRSGLYGGPFYYGGGWGGGGWGTGGGGFGGGSGGGFSGGGGSTGGGGASGSW